jgi:hypothetical protein
MFTMLVDGLPTAIYAELKVTICSIWKIKVQRKPKCVRRLLTEAVNWNYNTNKKTKL